MHKFKADFDDLRDLKSVSGTNSGKSSVLMKEGKQIVLEVDQRESLKDEME